MSLGSITVTRLEWTCPACGTLHIWHWHPCDAQYGDVILMVCEACPIQTRVRLADNWDNGGIKGGVCSTTGRNSSPG